MSDPRLSTPHVPDGFGMNAVSFRENGSCFTAAANRSNDAIRQLCAAAPANVLSSGDWFKMGGVDATSNTAEMIELKSRRNVADELLVRNNMGDSRPPSADTDLSVVEIGRISSLPDPARCVISTILHEVVVLSDRATRRPGTRTALITETCPARARWNTANLAMKYLTHRVTSLVEEARKGLEKMRFSSPSYYLDTIEEGRK